MLLQYAAMGYGAYTLVLPLAKTMRGPRKVEAARLNALRDSTLSDAVRSDTIPLVFQGTACLVAWRYADLSLLWLCIGVVLLLLASFGMFYYGIRKAMPEQAAEADKAAAEHESSLPPREEHLDSLARSRVRIALSQLALLAIWLYAWRHLYPWP